MSTPTRVAVDTAGFRAVARTGGPVVALTALHEEIGEDVLPAGAGGHVFVPDGVEARCDRYETPAGPRPRTPGLERPVGQVVLGADTLRALHVPGAGPAGYRDRPAPWSVGLGWVRLGLADRFLDGATAHLRGRTVQDTVTLNLPLVRVLLADAAAAVAEARALLATGPDADALRRVHRSLDEVGRTCLHLYGATGFLLAGPGAEIRVAELIGDTYAPTTGLERP